MFICSSITYDKETWQMKAHGSIVRKGAWTKEEDNLLRNCIGQWGEGEWSRVPQRAGLNRCRKSCRLRWLNYLKPNIKRGVFQEDEVDMIIRLHKLLGNRWSLIAGRLPGRTANHVKNYCNNKLIVKKPRPSPSKEEKESVGGCWDENRVKTIKPRPHNISKKLVDFGIGIGIGMSQSRTDELGTQVKVGYASQSQRQRDGIGLDLLYEGDADPLWDSWLAEGFEVENLFLPFPSSSQNMMRAQAQPLPLPPDL